jgi:uncharacterized protein (TIRG00374 family)
LHLRQALLLFLKIGVTAGLVYWLLSNVELGEIARMSMDVGPAVFLAAVAIHVVSFSVTAVRWWLLLRHSGERVRLQQILPSYYLGVFFNNLLPTNVGGDVVRTIYLHRRGYDLKALAASLIIDRSIGLLALLLVASACAVFASQPWLGEKLRASALMILIGCLAGTALAFSPWTGRLLAYWQRRASHTKRRRELLDSAAICYSYRSNPSLLCLAVSLSVVAQSAMVVNYVLIGNSIGIDLPAVSYFVIVPVVVITTILPISLGGLGVREGALVVLLMLAGVDRQLAIGLSLIYLATFWTSTLPGALVLLAGKRAERRLPKNV